MPDDARHRHERVTARAIEVVVMGADQLEAGASVLDLQLAGDAAGSELLGGAKHRGKIGHPAVPGEPLMQLLERPGMAFSAAHQADHRGGNLCFARHGANFNRPASVNASYLRKLFAEYNARRPPQQFRLPCYWR